MKPGVSCTVASPAGVRGKRLGWPSEGR